MHTRIRNSHQYREALDRLRTLEGYADLGMPISRQTKSTMFALAEAVETYELSRMETGDYRRSK